ncbi:MAG: RNA-binding cell elongation regulator Jag/EloR [Rubrobacter sp.]
MSNGREFNASSVEEAVKKAAVEFGLASEQIEYEIVDRGSEGFLGIGARDARITVTAPETSERNEALQIEEPSFHPQDETPLELPAEESDEDTESVFFGEETPEQDAPDSSPDPESSTPENTLQEIKNLTESFVLAMGFQSQVDVYDAGEFIAADIASDHTALLIGQKGETLESLQHLINCAAYQQEIFSKRVVLDSEGYRQRRIEAIQGMAHRSARRAVKEGQDSQLPPMTSPERRVVHLYLENDENVTTYSEGSGDQRRVVISPANQ